MLTNNTTAPFNIHLLTGQLIHFQLTISREMCQQNQSIDVKLIAPNAGVQFD